MATQKERDKKHYAKHKEKIKARAKKYYLDNTEVVGNRIREYRKKNPEKEKLRQLKANYKANYNITIEEYNKFFSKQNGKCAICEKHQNELNKRLYVDHCHSTNIIRGLLCYHCNTGLGVFKDNIDILEKAKNYLTNLSQ